MITKDANCRACSRGFCGQNPKYCTFAPRCKTPNGVPEGTARLWKCIPTPRLSAEGCGNCFYRVPNNSYPVLLCGDSGTEYVGFRVASENADKFRY